MLIDFQFRGPRPFAKGVPYRELLCHGLIEMQDAVPNSDKVNVINAGVFFRADFDRVHSAINAKWYPTSDE